MKYVTVLLPGSFKPMHQGHIGLIKRYINHPSVKKIKVLIGPGTRNGITQQRAYKIARILLGLNIDLEKTKYITPVLASYKYMENAIPGTYAFAGVSKGNDYKRVTKFVNDFNGKYPLPNNVYVKELIVDTIEPTLYKGRTDDKNGLPISASVLRQDVLNNDFVNFVTNYSSTEWHQIKQIWNILQSIIIK